MTDTPKKLSETARALLTCAASRPDHLMHSPQLPVAAARQVVRSLLKAGFVQEVPASKGDPTDAWRIDADGVPVRLQATPLGLAAIGTTPGTDLSPPSEAVIKTLKPVNTATAETAAPDTGTAIAIRRDPGANRHPRTTKQARVIAMLRRSEGASGPAIAAAMGWAPHTVRGFLAGLAKKGIKLEVLERVRQIGPNKAGAQGSYTIYRIGNEGDDAGGSRAETEQATASA